MGQPPAANVVASEGLRTDQDSGLFVFGLAMVPDSMKAGARWLFDHAFGLDGDKTFNLLWAYHAGYLLMNYPFDVTPKPPGESLPWVAPDPTGGHWIFRKPWQGADDTLVVLNPRFDFPGGTHWTVGKSWDMQLFALGRLWIGDRVMGETTGTSGAGLPITSNPMAFNDALSARLKDWHATPDGLAVLSFDMSPVYMQQLGRGEEPPAGRKMVKMPRGGMFIDLGIRAERHVALDLSGACGAPVLFVVLDKTSGALGLQWRMQLSKEAGTVKVDGNTVVVGEADGPNLRAYFVPMTGLQVTGGAISSPAKADPNLPPFIREMQMKAIKAQPGKLEATGSDNYFVVLTIQSGAAPAITVNGEGFDAKITVGKRAFRFDGEKMVVEE
jgi:hypothetical protein